jgi:NH3-dependent NAD+ synthetase
MGRFNQTIDGVFTDIVEVGQIPSYDKFLNYGDDIKQSKDLKKITSEYKTQVKTLAPTIEKLALMEEIIMQMRSKETIEDIKLSLVRDYIYARCPFFRRGKISKDIRVIVDKSEFWKFKNVDDLLKNKDFVERAISKLTKAMDNEIKNNVHQFNKTK